MLPGAPRRRSNPVLEIAEHPLLDAGVFVTRFPRPLGECAAGEEIARLVKPGASAPLASDDAVRKHVRDLLRWGGYKPTGRGKPSSEYLIAAVAEGSLPSINAAVDACNAVSYHSGLPISVVDLGRTRPPCSIAVAPAGASYVFNASGQTIDLSGLVCLFDGEGPCANAVKDAQRTKTHAGTEQTLSVIWGTRALPARTAETVRWYRELLDRMGFATEVIHSTGS
jgi:DNA/RNA-binding domain of Phe-tRNA-synthetase-like protein